MKTITVNGFVYETDYGCGLDFVEYRFYSTDQCADRFNALIGPASFEFTIPDTFNPTAAKIEALNDERRRASVEFSQKVREIDERISKLQALTNEATQ